MRPPFLLAPILNAFRRIAMIALGIALFLPRPAAAADATPDAAIDLGQRYPATLDRAPDRKGYDWTCDAKDVWRLTGFTFSLGNQYRVEVKAAQVVLGHHGSNVLWAAVLPDQPGEIVKASAGQGEHITSIWLRFHPARLRELFPPSTVKGAGAKELIADAKRLAAHKMRACWQAGGKPMVPDQAVITVDLETREGPRRFFSINTVKSTVTYADAFKGRPLPAANTVGRESALAVFDTVWNAFDREYAMFVLKPDVDWPKLRDEFRARLPAAKDDGRLADLLAEMLAHLKDLHVGVRVGGVEVPVYQRHRRLNANRRAVPKLLGPVTVAGHGLSWCVTADGIGYIAIDRLTDADLPQGFDEVLENMERTRGLILDLRSNGGGSEPLGLEIAGSFLDGEHVYAKSQYRNGPRHADLTPPKDRKCRPKNPWHFVAPLIVLQGQRTMSSAEGLVLMLSQCPQVTTLGDRTAGSSGNPGVLNAGAGITVRLPRWIDLDAQGRPFDAVGISPQIVVNTKEADFAGEADPVLAAALERLHTTKVEGPALTLRAGAVRPNQLPHVVAVTPARGAVGIDPVTEIRIRFDRPMDPRTYHLQWRPIRGESNAEVGFRLRGTVRYEAGNNEFVFPVRLTPAAIHRIQVVSDDPRFHLPSIQRLFRSVDGCCCKSLRLAVPHAGGSHRHSSGRSRAATQNSHSRPRMKPVESASERRGAVSPQRAARSLCGHLSRRSASDAVCSNRLRSASTTGPNGPSNPSGSRVWSRRAALNSGWKGSRISVPMRARVSLSASRCRWEAMIGTVGAGSAPLDHRPVGFDRTKKRAHR